MALSKDQQAMLRLLAQREQGYEDIAALMGLSVEEVRVKVKEALEEIDKGEQPRAEPVRPPVEAEEPPAPPAQTEEPTPIEAPEKPAEAPKAAPPPDKPSTPAGQPARSNAKPSSSLLSWPSLPAERRRLILLAGGALAVVAVALVAILIIGGGSSSSTTTTATTTASAPAKATAAEEAKLTQALLLPVDGSDAEGRALFGRLKKEVVLQVEASGLKPTSAGQSYTIWLYRSPTQRLPLAVTKVSASGKLAGQFPVPTEVLSYLAGGAFGQIDISLTSDARFKAALDKAKKEKKTLSYTGTDVLRGKVTGPVASQTSAANGG